MEKEFRDILRDFIFNNEGNKNLYQFPESNNNKKLFGFVFEEQIPQSSIEDVSLSESGININLQRNILRIR